MIISRAREEGRLTILQRAKTRSIPHGQTTLIPTTSLLLGALFTRARDVQCSEASSGKGITKNNTLPQTQCKSEIAMIGSNKHKSKAM